MRLETLNAMQEFTKAVRLMADALTKEPMTSLDYTAIIEDAARRLDDAIENENATP